MLAVIKTGGKQYTVSPKDVIKIEKLDVAVGDKVTFDAVLVVADDKGSDVKVGTPTVKGATVTGIIRKQTRTKKVTGIKYKNKVRYQKRLGHRQHVSEVHIDDINV